MLVKASILIVALSSLVNAAMIPRGVSEPASLVHFMKRQGGNCAASGLGTCSNDPTRCAPIGYQCCDDDGIAPPGYFCCMDGTGNSCRVGTVCVKDKGCCPVGETCTGTGGIQSTTLSYGSESTSTITNTNTNTITDTIISSPTASASAAASSAAEPSAAASSGAEPSASPSGKKQCTPKKKK